MAATTIINGLAIGASLSVTDSTALSNLDPNGLTIGTSVSDLGTPATWILTISTAGLSSTVKAVKGITGWRWVQATSGGVSSIAVAGNLATSGATGAITLTGPGLGTLVSIPSATADVTIAVDMDTFGDVEITGYIVPESASINTITLQPNASATNLESVSVYGNAGSSAGSLNSATSWRVGDNGSVASPLYLMSIIVRAKSGRHRQMTCLTKRGTNAGNNQLVELNTGTSTDLPAVNVTSLVLHSSVALGIANTSLVRWRYIGFSA